jgi:hypothetical protein
MRLKSLITPEMYEAIRNLPNVSITPYKPKVRIVPMGLMGKLGYPDPKHRVGDVGKVLPSKPPQGYVLGNGHAFEVARVFGCKSRL